MKQASILDVAREAGVSKSTVSNYLNGRYATMSEETKNRVQKVIEELDYVPSISARRLASKTNGRTLCVIAPEPVFAPDTADSIASETLDILYTLASQNHYHMLLYIKSSSNETNEIDFIRSIAAAMVDGFICFDLQETDEYYKAFNRQKTPYVCIGKSAYVDDYRYIATDHMDSTKKALHYLIRNGHRKIAFILENQSSIVHAVRLLAYQETLQQEGIPYDEQMLLEFTRDSKWKQPDDSNPFIQLWQSDNRPSAVVVIGSALESFESILKKNPIAIPGELSVVVLNHVESSYFSYDYTSTQSKLPAVVQSAFRKLIKSIDNPDYHFKSQLMKLEFHEGETVNVLPDSTH